MIINMSLLRRLWKQKGVIPIVRISGAIDNLTAHNLDKDLTEFGRIRNLDALAIILDSQGGSGMQCDVVAERLRTFCDEKNIKLYAFVETRAFSAAALPFFVADRRVCHRGSLIGRFTASTFALGLVENFGAKRFVTESEGYDAY